MNQNKEVKVVPNKDSEGLNTKFDPFDITGLYNYLRRPTRLFFLNLLAGMARGLGFAIGMTILAALIILLLRRVVNVPYLGNFIARILEVVETQRSLYR